jgi:hypothetical protein
MLPRLLSKRQAKRFYKLLNIPTKPDRKDGQTERERGSGETKGGVRRVSAHVYATQAAAYTGSQKGVQPRLTRGLDPPGFSPVRQLRVFARLWTGNHTQEYDADHDVVSIDEMSEPIRLEFR